MQPTNYVLVVEAKKLRNGFEYEVRQYDLAAGDRLESMDKGKYVIEHHWNVVNKKDYNSCQIAARTPIDEVTEAVVRTLEKLAYDDEVSIRIEVRVNPPKAA